MAPNREEQTALALGRWLREQREAAGLSVAQVACYFPWLSGRQIQMIEAGQSSVRPRDLCEIIALYGATAEELFEAVGLIPPEGVAL